MAEEVVWMSSPRRSGVFVLSLYEDGPGKLCCMTLWPGGAVRTVRAVEIAQIMAQASADILGSVLHRFEECEQGGAFDEDGLAAVKPKGGKGSRFDATA